MRHLVGSVVAGLALAAVLGTTALAQDADAPPDAAVTRSPDDLDQLVAPLALYPDPLIAEIMAAATFPDQLVLADRYLTQGMSVDDMGQQGLDPSVQSLAHYPTLLKWLDDNLPWTTQLGQAFTAQEGDVMDAVQRLRAKAQSLGNLQSTPQENIVNDEGQIEIEPVDPDTVYVPEYDPATIYYTPGIFCGFGIGLPVGLWWRHDWDWHHHSVIYWGAQHPRPHGWWGFSPVQRHNAPSVHVWHPPQRHGTVYAADRGYARPIVAAPPRAPVRPAQFRSGGEARPANVGRENGAERAVVPPTRAFEPPTRAVVPESHAVMPPSHAVVPPTRAVEPEARALAPREAAPSIERAAEPARGGGGMFGGIENSRATQASSMRGAESRGITAPAGGGRGSVSMGSSSSAGASHGGNSGQKPR